MYDSKLGNRRFDVVKICAADDYISELSEREIIEYFKQEYGKQETSEKSIGSDTSRTTSTDSVQERDGGSKSGSRSGSRSGTNLPDGSTQEKHGSSDSLLGKYRSFKSGLGERSRKAEKERNKKLTPQEKEDLEKFYTGEFAKENDLGIKDFYSLGTKALVG